jgi:hypothetical protein
MEADRPAIYRPRKPRASPLWQCVSRHLPELRAAGRVRHAVEENVLERFLECGDLHRGFARIRCGGCGHDLRLRPARAALAAVGNRGQSPIKKKRRGQAPI